jgi:hypothetical protein
VIGSRIIQEIESGAPDAAPARARAWLSGIRAALDDAKGVAATGGVAPARPSAAPREA